MRVVVVGKHPRPREAVAVALARHQRQRLRVHRRRRRLHLRNRRRQVDPLRQPVVRIRRPRLILPPQPQVHRQPVVQPPVVLHIRRIPLQVRRLQRHQPRRRLPVQRPQQERRPLVPRVHHVRAVRRVRRQRRVEHQVDRLEPRRFAEIRAHLAAPLQVVRPLIPVHPRRHRPRVRVLIPLAPLPPQPVRRRRPRPRRHVQRRVIHIPAVVQRAVPLVVPPVVRQPLRPQQQRRVVELVHHVVVAAPHIQRRPVRHHPHRVAGKAHPVAVAPRQREEPRVGRVLLIQVGLELPVARKHLELVVDVPVHPLREVPVVHLLVHPALPVVLVARQVRQRQRLQHLHRHRIEQRRRNHVARKRRPHHPPRRRIHHRAERVVNRPHPPAQRRLAEVPRPLELRRHRPHDRQRPLVVPLLERREREHLVLQHRPAQRRPIHLQVRPAQLARVLPRRQLQRRIRNRVERRVPPVEIRRPLVAVRPRLHVQADHPAQRVPVLRVDRVLRHRHFFNRVHRRRIRRLEARPQRHAVEQHRVRALRPAARVVVVRIRVVIRPVLVRRRRHHDRRVQVRQVVRVPPRDRHLVEQLLLERDVVARRVELHRHRRRFHRHRLFQPAHLQHQFDRQVAPLLHAHVLLLGPPEPVQLANQRVRPRIHEVDQIPPFAIRRPRHRHARLDVRQRHRRARQRPLALIHHLPLDTRPIVLGVNRRDQAEQGNEHPQQPTHLHDDPS